VRWHGSDDQRRFVHRRICCISLLPPSGEDLRRLAVAMTLPRNDSLRKQWQRGTANLVVRDKQRSRDGILWGFNYARRQNTESTLSQSCCSLSALPRYAVSRKLKISITWDLKLEGDGVSPVIQKVKLACPELKSKQDYLPGNLGKDFHPACLIHTLQLYWKLFTVSHDALRPAIPSPPESTSMPG